MRATYVRTQRSNDRVCCDNLALDLAMADVVHLNPEEDTVVEAEPDERSRRIVVFWLPCFIVAALVASFPLAKLFHHRLSQDRTLPNVLLDLAVRFLWILCLVHACWLVPVFVLLIAEWSRGNPAGSRFVDTLLQSDESWLIRLPIHQFLRHVY